MGTETLIRHPQAVGEEKIAPVGVGSLSHYLQGFSTIPGVKCPFCFFLGGFSDAGSVQCGSAVLTGSVRHLMDVDNYNTCQKMLRFLGTS